MANLRTIGVRLRLLIGDYKRDADDAGKSTDQLSDKIHKAGRRSEADLDKIATGAGIAGAALLAAAGAAVVASATFDKQMSEVGAVANASAEDLDRLREAAIEAGQATVFSARDAAEAEAELAKAGVSTADILGGALTGSLDLASAGQLELADAATIAAASMNTFGLKGADVAHVADVLAAAANKSAAGVDDLGLGLQQVGLVANQVGFTFEETVALLAALADRGLRGSDGATSLKTALSRLAAPTAEAQSTMKALGISLYDTNGNMVDAVTIAGQLEQGLKDLTPAQRNAALQTIFGSDAIRAANVLFAEGAAGIQDYIDAVDDQGAASRVAGQKLDNLAGDVEQLTGSLETLFISSGEGANGGLRVLTQAGTDLVNLFGELPGPVQTGAVVIAAVSGAALLAAAAGLKLKRTLGEVVEELGKTGPAGAKAARGLEATAMWGGRVVGVLGGLAIAASVVNAAFGEDLRPQTDALAEGLADWAENGKLAGESARLLGENAEKLDLALRNATSSGKGFSTWVEGVIPGAAGADASWTKNVERINAIDEALSHLVQGGRADEAAGVFALLQQRATELGIPLEELNAAFPAYNGALEVAGKEASTTAADTQKLAEETTALARATAFAVDEGETLVDLWDRMHGRVKSADEAMLDATKAIDAVSEAFKENGQALQGNSEKALENRIALENAARLAAAAAEAYLAMTGDVEGAKKIMKDFQAAAEKATGATGKAKDEVHKLADELFQLPQTKDVVVNLRLVGSALGLQQKLNRLDFAAGGLVEHADRGLLSEAAVFRPRSPAIYAFAEPSTKGEAFVPKQGNYSRSMSILSAAAGWYNADVVPRGGWYGPGGAGGDMPVVNLEVKLVDSQTGAVQRKALITDALNRNVPQDRVSAAYP